MSRTGNFFVANVEAEGDAAVMKSVADGARAHDAKVVPTLCASGGSVYSSPKP